MSCSSVLAHNERGSVLIESYVSKSHIGFDPDCEVIKKRDPLYNGTPVNRMA